MLDDADVGAVFGPEDFPRLQAAYDFVLQLLGAMRFVTPDDRSGLAKLVMRIGTEKSLSCDEIIARCTMQLGMWISSDPGSQWLTRARRNLPVFPSLQTA